MPAKPKPVKQTKPQTKPKKRRKKTARQLAEIRLDALVKEIVLQRDGGCVCPPPLKGHRGGRSPGHLITRGKESVKWDLLNVHEQCASCNARHEHYPEIFTNWFIQRFGEIEYSGLVSRSYKVSKLTLDDLETLEFELIEVQKLMTDGWKPYITQRELLSGEWRKDG
jgi:hypothetical protein